MSSAKLAAILSKGQWVNLYDAETGIILANKGNIII